MLREKEEDTDERVVVSCCTNEFSMSSGERAIRQLAYHLERKHNIPREASAKWLLADAHVRDTQKGSKDAD